MDALAITPSTHLDEVNLVEDMLQFWMVPSGVFLQTPCSAAHLAGHLSAHAEERQLYAC